MGNLFRVAFLIDDDEDVFVVLLHEILLAGETLRYRITVKNIGNADAVNVVLRDAVPVNTTYVVDSTTLNGAPVPDSGGLSALVNGMLIHSTADPTPGSMPADASNNQANVATIGFDVVLDVEGRRASPRRCSPWGRLLATELGTADRSLDRRHGGDALQVRCPRQRAPGRGHP